LFRYTSTVNAATFVYSRVNTNYPFAIGTTATLTYANVTHKMEVLYRKKILGKILNLLLVNLLLVN